MIHTAAHLIEFIEGFERSDSENGQFVVTDHYDAVNLAHAIEREFISAYATLYENAIWRLHDLMDQIREAQDDGNTGDASDLAHEARPLFMLFPDQPDPRTYAEKTRDEMRKRGHLDSAP